MTAFHFRHRTISTAPVLIAGLTLTPAVAVAGPNDGINALISVTQAKAANANDDALKNAPKSPTQTSTTPPPAPPKPVPISMARETPTADAGNCAGQKCRDARTDKGSTPPR